MFEKFNVNWSAFWRKAVVGAAAAGLMGYTYRANKHLDEAIDAKYPAPGDAELTDAETS